MGDLDLGLLVMLNEKAMNDNYILKIGTNVDRKLGLRTHQANLFLNQIYGRF